MVPDIKDTITKGEEWMGGTIHVTAEAVIAFTRVKMEPKEHESADKFETKLLPMIVSK